MKTVNGRHLWKLAVAMLVVGAVVALAPAAFAEEAAPPPTPESNATAIALVQSHADYVWTLVAAFLLAIAPVAPSMVTAT